MLQLLGQKLLLIQQAVLLRNQHLHLFDGLLQKTCSRRRGDGLGQDIGETGEEVDVVFVVVMLPVVVDLQYVIGLLFALYDDIHGRDDAMRAIEFRQVEPIVLA